MTRSPLPSRSFPFEGFPSSSPFEGPYYGVPSLRGVSPSRASLIEHDLHACAAHTTTRTHHDQAKLVDPKTPRPDDVEFDNGAYTNPKYAGAAWYIADHLRDPSKPIVPLSTIQPSPRQLNADFIDKLSDASNHCDERPKDRIRHGHRNLSTCSMTSVVAANWAGAYKFADDISKQVKEEAKEGWVDSPMPYPSTWPFRLEQQNGVAQGVKDDGTTKVRRSTDKGFGEDSVNECIELIAKLKLCTNLQIGKAAAVIATADAGERTAPNADEDPDDPATIADDRRTYLWKIDLTAAYRQITIHQLYLWMCHTSWNGDVYKRLTPIVVFYCIMTTSGCETCENGPLSQCFAVWRCRARLGCSSARKWTVLTWICSRPASVAQIQQGLHKFVRGLECQRRRLPLRSVLVRRTDLHRDRIGPYADGLG